MVSLSIASTLCNTASSVTLLFQNNLNGTDDANHVGFLMLDEFAEKDAPGACKVFSEGLLTKSTIKAHSADIIQSLSYVAWAGRADNFQLYFIDQGVLGFNHLTQQLSFPQIIYHDLELPVLCTQSDAANKPGLSKATTANQVQVASGENTYVGFRNQKSFRFLGIPYADPPQRWVYSNLYSGTGQTINATAYGPQCAQGSSGSENCLFLNIQTPYIPKQGDTSDLRPVMFWIHGGGFTGGSGADQLSDGGNLASREDIVVVNINYRLSTLGFLAIPGTNITGNYGIADQITALQVNLHLQRNQ
jgi:Carboxylesterase family